MKKTLLLIVLLVAVVYVSFDIYNKEKLKAASPEDINIEATLKQNENQRVSHKDFMLEVVIDKKKVSQHMIYPYIKGIGSMTYDGREEEGYFIPGNIGLNNIDVEMVIQTLTENQIIDVDMDYSFIGFWSPEESGTYKMRMYFQKGENIELPEDMCLVYVHKGKRNFGLDDMIAGPKL